ncbi:hypothetical protein MAPG_11232, partial [Magnaporthiopsis poae ATCC 64411]
MTPSLLFHLAHHIQRRLKRDVRSAISLRQLGKFSSHERLKVLAPIITDSNISLAPAHYTDSRRPKPFATTTSQPEMDPWLEAKLRHKQKTALIKGTQEIAQRIQWLVEEKRYIEEIQEDRPPQLHHLYETKIADAARKIYSTFLRALHLRGSLERRRLGAATQKPKSAYAAGKRS